MEYFQIRLNKKPWQQPEVTSHLNPYWMTDLVTRPDLPQDSFDILDR